MNPHSYESEAISTTSEERHYHHDNDSGHAPSSLGATEYQQTSGSASVYHSDPPRVAALLPPQHREGEEGAKAGEGGEVVQGEGLSTQMSQMHLKDPAYYEAVAYSTAVPHTVAAGYVPESHSQYLVSHSNKYPMATVQDHRIGAAPQHLPPHSTGTGIYTCRIYVGTALGLCFNDRRLLLSMPMMYSISGAGGLVVFL